MKKVFKSVLTLILVSFCIITVQSQTVSSVANGNWSNPLTWGGTIPLPGNTIIINHNVVLDMDFGYNSGSITVNAGASLIGNNPMRVLAQYNGLLDISGTLNVPRIALFGGNVTNKGMLQADSLFNEASIMNNANANINASQFFVSFNGFLHNNGNVVSTNFLNVSEVINENKMVSNDMMNSKSFLNTSTGEIVVQHNFQNDDSLASPAVFTNNGYVEVAHDWRNTDSIKGNGRFCVANNSSNSGVMSGNFDFCDMTGVNVDANTGIIDANITWCQYPCNIGVNNTLQKNTFTIYPNPVYNQIFIESEQFPDGHYELLIYNIIGKLYSQQTFDVKDKLRFTTDVSELPNGIYTLILRNNSNCFRQTFIKN